MPAEPSPDGDATDVPESPDAGDSSPGYVKRLGIRYQHIRHNHPLGHLLRYVTITVGVLVTAVGAVTIPYPGPGWAIVFLGLLILSQELEWAAKLRHTVMGLLNDVYRKYIDGNLLAQALLAIGTCAIVLATLWVTGGLALFAGWVGIEWAWLASPFFG
ncbi:TIGR02611 family protein [Gordonia alkaliphila]|uniref:TIGR02611 family protein n=1 Tax=Gordonia alkaliphila TaxID=1053547 RepID=A0ABP8ZE95_9ACTN|nr:PGPGW domain-containing protein [Gordonia alkaliphila]MCK0437916.1 TIGR02611 family protein [Gordonia alkaliphila]